MALTPEQMASHDEHNAKILVKAAEERHGVTVADLIVALSTLPPAARVVLAKDAEGNGFSPLNLAEGPDVSLGTYIPDSTWSGEFQNGDVAPDAVCLWPVN